MSVETGSQSGGKKSSFFMRPLRSCNLTARRWVWVSALRAGDSAASREAGWTWRNPYESVKFGLCFFSGVLFVRTWRPFRQGSYAPQRTATRLHTYTELGAQLHRSMTDRLKPDNISKRTDLFVLLESASFLLSSGLPALLLGHT